MRKLGRDDVKQQFNQPENLQPVQQKDLTFEAFVDADFVAAHLGVPRKNVIRWARERRITSYPMSGRVRYTYKFKLSLVDRDMEKFRRPAADSSDDNNSARH
jgi:hypothetical protein